MRQQKGFSLLEIVFAMSISAILYAIVGMSCIAHKAAKIQSDPAQACVQLKLKFQMDCKSVADFNKVLKAGNSNYLVELFVKGKGFDINEKNQEGLTPLMVASRYLYPDKAQSLIMILEAGGDPLARDNNGISAEQYLQQSDFGPLYWEYKKFKQAREVASGKGNNQ
jgi:prepilin-type N-terminal cleavage/methylation domain-containing protein